MNEALTISTQKPEDIAFDYSALRREGIKHIEQLASGIWTDYNIHDPGITSLELLCYAITDLSYRSRYPIPDLMFGKDDSAKNITEQFHTAKQIFPNKALTINDYRKLIIDIEGIKNAWIQKRTKNLIADLTNKSLIREAPPDARTKGVVIKGFYDVLVEFDTTVKEEQAQNALIEEVRNLLQRNRNLDEDFETPMNVPQQSFLLCCDIDIDPGYNIQDVLASIYFNLQLHLSPLVKFYSLQQMLDDGYPADKIFEGPFPNRGFIKNDELLASELKTKIRLSDLMQIILNVEGVINIPDIIFNDVDQKEELINKWLIDVKEGNQPVVDILRSNIVVHKNGVPHRLSKKEQLDIKLKFDEMMAAYLNANETVTSADLNFYTGTYRDVPGYYSIQNHFPKTYGISHWGLPEDATAERKKQAKQFQAYLWLFDQVLANYLSQLSSVKNLFSLENEKQTYFTQLVNDFKHAESLFVDKTKIAGNLQVSAESNDIFLQRRNIFLDHLLSRFAESFYDYVGILHSLFPYTAEDKIIDLKRAFLKNYPEYSSQRALAYNYSDAENIWDSDNISGFEKRVQHLLGFENVSRRSLVNLLSAIQEEENAGVKKFWFTITDIRSGTTLLQGAEKFEDIQKAKDELDIALMLVNNKDNFQVVKDPGDGKFLYELRDKLNNLIAVGSKGTKKKAEADLELLLKLLDNMSEEGMFLVEHLLLYEDAIKNFLPICVDENCDDCSDTDPYSFRISIIMPAYAKRFLNMDFRQYVERVMREEMPSHLMVKICWISNEQLQVFEEIYKLWLQVKTGKLADTDGAILKKFIEVFTSLKSVYPEGALMDCDDEKATRLFMLSKNSLGTIKTS